jgi:DNA-binding PadR family transcriptional regulator
MTRGKTNPFPSFQYALLGQLISGPTYGYVLHKQLSNQQGIGVVWSMNLANLYAVLEQLEKKGWLSVSLQPGNSRPGRKMYQITELGKAEFDAWLNTPATHPRELRQDFMIRLHYYQSRLPDQVPALLRGQLSHCRTWLKDARETLLATPPEESFAQSVYRYRILQIQSMIEWLELELRALQDPQAVEELFGDVME